MKIHVLEAQPCRSYDLVLDDEARDRHFELMMAFIKRGIVSPRGGGSVPNLERHTGVEGKYRIVHFLAEEVCDEYELGMGIAQS